MVLPNASRNDGVALRDIVERFDGFLLSYVARLIVGKWVFFFTAFNRCIPFTDLGLFEFSFFSQLGHTLERVFNIRMDRVFDALIFIMLGNVDVDVDNFCVRCEFGD